MEIATGRESRAHRLRCLQPTATLDAVITHHSHQWSPLRIIVAYARHTVKRPRSRRAVGAVEDRHRDQLLRLLRTRDGAVRVRVAPRPPQCRLRVQRSDQLRDPAAISSGQDQPLTQPHPVASGYAARGRVRLRSKQHAAGGGMLDAGPAIRCRRASERTGTVRRSQLADTGPCC